MPKVSYGVWKGVRYDNRNGEVAEPPDLPLDELFNFNPGNPIAGFIGSQGFLVFDPDVSLAAMLERYYAEARANSCGRCTPCRTGSILLALATEAAAQGKADTVDWEHMMESAKQMAETSLCGVGRTTPAALIGALTYFRKELFGNKGFKGDVFTTMTAKCVEACPAHVNIPRYIDYVRDGHPDLADGVLLLDYPMVACLGRVCARPCEKACRRNAVDTSVAIKDIKRYIGDHAGASTSQLFHNLEPMTDPTKASVAVVGAGPAGLNCAYHLLMKGYPVDIYEKDIQAGGMALRGIPPYRLPKKILQDETDAVAELGGRWYWQQALGRDFTINDLFKRGYGAVFIGIGCAKGAYLGLPDEDTTIEGYRNGIDFLLEVEKNVGEGKTTPLEGDVVVVGCGNVAMDCCRTAVRLTHGKVHVVYRRTEKNASADHEEIVAAKEEGIEFHFLTNPVELISKDGKLTGVKLTKMQLGEKDARGRAKVTPVEGSEYILPCTTLIAAIGQKLDKSSLSEDDGILLSRWGTISVNAALGTSRPGVFAGGDCVTGPTTLIDGLAEGKLAASTIDEYLTRGSVGFTPRVRMHDLIKRCKLLENDDPDVPERKIARATLKTIPIKFRDHSFREVDQTLTTEAVRLETERCMRCYRLFAVVTPRPIPGNEQEKPASLKMAVPE